MAVEENLEKAMRAITEAFVNSTSRQGAEIRAEALEFTPKDTGATRRSAFIRRRKSPRGTKVGVGYGTPYAPEIEKPKGFLRKAVKNAKNDNYVEKMSDRTWARYLALFGGFGQ